ncbi:AAA family ATPase [Spirosoma agri]|uniref:AAA family ATPase n=1 Tax=Spirosoma agri TaxID=1987381 RepID=A0A6M0IJG2_9BACT|nr:AAA family ATPase [Spirosoma agri]NEU67511.1 AAA family ATPase [Spirosoma agri]
MKINRLVIENFKSIERIELVEPNPFTVFVGPNGSGKSNIFEALEFFNLAVKTNRGTVESLFGGKDYFLNRRSSLNAVQVEVKLNSSSVHHLVQRTGLTGQPEYTVVGTRWGEEDPINVRQENNQLLANFVHLFINQNSKQKLNYSSDLQLTLSADNLEKVLKRVLDNPLFKDEVFEWLELFIPGFKSVEVSSNPFDGKETLLWYEKTFEKPFPKELLSDGTKNILALLTAVYQSDEPQFLCIEEPENGLHPQVLETLVNFFRQECKSKGHFIWLNTHSEAVVRHLTTDEIILVNKQNGATKTRQIKGRNIYDLPTDQAWLAGALGGGLPW